MQRFHTLRIATVLLGLYAGACGDDDTNGNDGGSDNGADGGDLADAGTPPTDAGTIEVVGSWAGEFADEDITRTQWGASELIEFDNDENVAITQYPDDDMYNPNKFARYVWTEPTDDGFFYCMVEFDAPTLKAAQESDETADDSDPENEGCGAMNFPWTKLEPK